MTGLEGRLPPLRYRHPRHGAAEPMSGELAEAVTEILGPDGRHGSDYSYYYSNIKDNVAKRIATFKASQ